MRRFLPKLTVCLGSLLVALVLGCGGKVKDLYTAKSLKIGYTMSGKWKYLTVSEPKKVKEILDTISVEDTDNGAPGLIARDVVYFILPNDAEIKTSFVHAERLDRPQFGQIYLKDSKFYDKINEVLSKKEGSKIDVLEDNQQ